MKSIPRKDRRGGGVAVILKKLLSLKPNCYTKSFQSFEHLSTDILNPLYSKSINLTIIYRPPRSNKNTSSNHCFLRRNNRTICQPLYETRLTIDNW